MANSLPAPRNIAEAVACGVAEACAELVNASGVDAEHAPRIAARMAAAAFPEALAATLAAVALNTRLARAVAAHSALNSQPARAHLSACAARPAHAFTAADFAGS